MATNEDLDRELHIDRNADDRSPIWKRLSITQYLFLLSSFVFTAGLWLVGSAAASAEIKELKAFSEPLHDLALLVGSLGFFDSFKEFVFKEDYEKQKKALLATATSRFLLEMDSDYRIRSRGIRLIRDSFDTATLRSIILTLKRGDTLYCHDGSIADFSKLKEAIKSQAMNGVNFRFMAIAPFCKNAQRRGSELDEEIEDYSSGCRKFVSTIESIRTELADQQTFGEMIDSESIDRVKLKLYRSLMSIPFYLVVRNNKPAYAITGFYLRALSSSAIHIEWESKTRYKNSLHTKDPDGKKQIAEESSFITALWDYWCYKWNHGCEEYERAKRLEGKWSYISYTDDNIPIYEGECVIKEEAGSLKARGKRARSRIQDNNGVWCDWFETNIQWSTNVMHKYLDGNKLCLITSHNCYPQQGEYASTGTTAFMLLELNEGSDSTTAAGSDLVLEGNFFVSGKTKDVLFQAQSGKITFMRHKS